MVIGKVWLGVCCFDFCIKRMVDGGKAIRNLLFDSFGTLNWDLFA